MFVDRGSSISEWVVSVDSFPTSGNSTSEEVASLYCSSTSGSSISVGSECRQFVDLRKLEK